MKNMGRKNPLPDNQRGAGFFVRGASRDSFSSLPYFRLFHII